jgi:protocatechuate 3,4-dioxygenase beta subunit
LRVEALEDRTLLSSSFPLDPVNWTALGPGPIGSGGGADSGRLAALAAHPTDPNTIYVAAAGGGVWKTTNGGTNWTPLTDNQGSLFMGAIALAPSNPNIIYAGEGEANLGPSKLLFNRDNIYSGQGVLKSADAGATWTLLGNSVFNRRTISKIVVDPTDANTVYVAVGALANNGLPGNTGIWKSTDGGLNWSDTTAGISTTAAFSDVVMDSTDPLILYAAVGAPGGDSANGIYKTTNGGSNWTVAGNLPTGASDPHLGRISIALAPSAHLTLYAAIAASGEVDFSTLPFGKLYEMVKSTDGGATWTNLPNTPEYFGSYIGPEPNFFGDYDNTLAVDPTNANIVYAGGGEGGFIKTTNGGGTWSSAGSGVGVDHHGIGFDANGRLLVGMDQGIWRQTSPGSTSFTDINGNLNTIQFSGIATHPFNPDIAWGGSQDNGTERFNNALSWTELAGGDGGHVRVDPVNPNTVYYGADYDALSPLTQGSVFFRSDNNGATWTAKETGLDLSQPGNFYVPFVIDPAHSNRLLQGTSQVYESNNRGDNWAPLGSFVFPSIIDAVGVAPTDINTVYATSKGGHVFVTTNHGATWVERDPVAANPDLRYKGLFVDPTDANIAYVTATNYSDVTGGGHVWKTTNAGGSWTDITGDLPDIPVWTIQVDVSAPGTTTGVYYIGTDNGVYASSNGGANWTTLGTGLTHAQVVELDMNKNLGILAAGTHGRGLWELAIPPTAATWATVGPNVNISRASGNHSESTISINPTNPLNLFASETLGDPAARRYSTNGGVTWINSNSAGLPSSDGDIQTAWDRFGNLFITYLSTSLGVVVARSSDGGVTFRDPRTIVSSGGDQPSIAVGPSGVAGVAGSVWVSFTNSSGQIVAAGAPVNGFDSVGAFITPEVAPGPGGDFGDIAIGQGGQVMVTYQNQAQSAGPDTIKINLDPDGLGPQGFNPVIIATNTNVGGWAPIPAQPNRTIDAEANLAWDRSGGTHNGRVYLVYVDRASVSSNDTDIFVRYSDDNGTTWSNRVRVNDDPLGNGKSQLQPAIALDQTSGAVAVTWLDCRNSPANNTVQTFGTVSFDGGVSFLSNIQISNGSSNASLAGSIIDLGDYDKMDFNNGVFYRTWADNSNVLSDNPNGTLHQLNTYTAKVTVGASISGTVFNDIDGDGTHQPDEPGVAGWTIFLDLHNHGTLDPDDPTAISDALGHYTFNNPPHGTYAVREVLRAGWTQTAPASGFFTVTIVDNTTMVGGLDFGNMLLHPSSISGVVFHDLNADGVREDGEPGLAGVTVFIDANNNGRLDPGERFTVSGADGSYTIAGLEPGTYTVREIPQAGWVQSAPADQSFYTVVLGQDDAATGIDFGNYRPITLSGQVFDDVNGNGVKDPGEPGLAGWTVFVDQLGTGVYDPSDPHAVTNAQGNYAIAGIRPGTVVLREVLQPNWAVTLPSSGFYTFDAVSNIDRTGLDFGNESGTVTGQVFGDINGTGIKVPGDPGLAGWQLYLDLNNTGVFDASDPTATSDAQGNYIFSALAPGAYTVREVVRPGWAQTAPAGGSFTFTIVDASTTVTGADFGNFQLASISGTVYNDINANNARDAGEPGLVGWIIYDDRNNSGVFLPGDPFAISNAQGSYTLGNVGPGTHHIREYLPTGWIPTGSAVAGYTITPTSGQSLTGRDFGDRLFNPASISGQVFHDLNADGIPNTGEPGLAGWTVFIDANNSGMLDPGDQFTVTDAQGHFTLAGLQPGTQIIREVLQSTWLQSAPAAGFATVTVSVGQSVSGVAFGNYHLVNVSGRLSNNLTGAGLAGWTVFDDVNNDGTLHQSTSTFDPDNFADHQRLNTAFPGVTLSYLASYGGYVEALPTPPGSAGGARVFGGVGDSYYSPEFYDDSSGYQLRINFANPVMSVSIDAIGSNHFSTQVRGRLRIYNASNVLLATFTSPNLLAPGQLATLTLSRPTADIAYAVASSDNFDYGVLLDNLRFTASSEPFAITDANGNYTLTGLKPGDHIIRDVLQSDWLQTTPAGGFYTLNLVSGQNQSGINFGVETGIIQGAVFNDLNGDGIREAGEPGLSGWTIFADLDNSGVFRPGDPFALSNAQGNYTLIGLHPGTYVLREVLQTGWVVTAPSAGFLSVTIGDLPSTVTGVDFGDFRLVSISGNVFDDFNGDGVRQSNEPGLAGWTVFLDSDGDGVLQPGDQSTLTDAQGNYTLANVGPGAFGLFEVLPTGWVQTAPSGGSYPIITSSGSNQSNKNFGDVTGIAQGVVFNDLNGDGIRQAGEPGLAGWTIFADLNNSGVLADNDPRAVTDSQGNFILGGLTPGTYVLREVLQTGWAETAPAGGFFTVTIDDPRAVVSGLVFGNFQLVTVSGTVYNDINGNGSRDAGEPALGGWTVYDDLNNTGAFQPGDPFAVTNAQGSYSLSNVGPGIHHIRELPLSGWISTAPAGGAGYTLTTSSGQNITGRDFGDQLLNAASISGTVFHDLNADGVQEPGEPGLAGWRVFIDANNTGVDTGQQFAVTDAQGNYTLSGLQPGTYTVREVLQATWLRSAPGSYTVTVSAGQSATGRDFGNYHLVTISGQVVNDTGGQGLAGWTVYDDVNNNGVFDQATSTFEPDNYNNNQVLNTAFPGVTLSFLGNSTNSVVALPTPPGSAGGARVFGETTGGFYSPEFYNDPSGSTWWLRINFANPVSAMSIDAIGTTRFSGQARGLLRIYSSANVLLGTATTANLLAGGELATLTLSRPTADIAYAYASSDQVNQGVLLDNLRFTSYSEPNAVTDANGRYTLSGLMPGDHVIREVVQHGWSETTPANGRYNVTLVSGQNQTGFDFANVQDGGPGDPVGGNPTGAITGQVFGDISGTGIKVPGDPGLSGWRIYLDLNNTGVFDPSDPNTLSNAQGNYSFTGLPAGTYRVREVVQAGWLETAPAGGFYTIAEDGSTTVTGNDFGNFHFATVSGTVYNDINGNGMRDAAEPGLSGWVIYDDLNNSGVLEPGDPVGISNAQGSYTLSTVGPGMHHIREYLPSGWIATGSAAAGYTVTTTSGQSFTGRDFGDRLVNPASISGDVFNDLNGDGIQEPGEPGLAGWTVFIDANNNGVLDPGEQSTVSDAQGNFTLGGLAPGTYTVREVLQTNWQRSAPLSGFFTVTVAAGQSVPGLAFGNYQQSNISGQVFNDLNGNGIKDPGEPGLAGWTVFVDLNNSGVLEANDPRAVTNAQGNYSLAGLAPGTYVLREVLQTGWTQTAPAAGFQTVTIDDISSRVTGIDFGDFRLVSISGNVWNDYDGDGVRQSNEPGLAGWTVFLDTLGHGVPEPGEPLALTDSTGNYTLTNIGPGTFPLREVLEDGWRQTAPAGGSFNITTTSGNNVTGRDFGNRTGVVQGVVFNDLNGDGIRQAGEPGLPGWTIFADLNHTGILDSSDPRAVTDSQGNFTLSLLPGTYVLREVLQAGQVQTAPTGSFYTITIDDPATTVTGLAFGNFRLVTVSGTVYNDVNGNGSRDAGEPGLFGRIVYDDLNNSGVFQPGDPFAVTNAQGSYSLVNVGPGIHHLREQALAGWIPTAPAGGAGYTLTTTSGQNVTSRDFGDQLLNAASISGTVFHDLNADGVREAGEPGLGGWTVYIDANNNGMLDPGEQFATTDAQGNFTLGGLPPGTYIVREVMQNNWQQSAPAAGYFAVTVSAGQSVAGLASGNYQLVSISGHVVDTNGHGLAGWTVFDDVYNDGIFHQTTSTFDPDNYPDNAPLNNVFPGVTLTYLGDSTHGVLAVPTEPGSAGGARAFGSDDPFYAPEFYSPGYELRIDFATPVSSLTIDAVATSQYSGLAGGQLLIFNANHVQIGSLTTANLAFGQLATMTLTRPTADIAYALASSNNYDYGVLLDDLSFTTSSEPYAITDANGGYTLSGLKPGDHIIREVVQAGWTETVPAEGFYSITLVSGQNQSGIDFVNQQDTGRGSPPGQSGGAGNLPVPAGEAPAVGNPAIIGTLFGQNLGNQRTVARSTPRHLAQAHASEWYDPFADQMGPDGWPS